MEDNQHDTKVSTKNPDASSDKKSKLYRITTLKKLGPNFPILRFGSDGKPIKNLSFSFQDWDMEVEEKLSELQSDSKTVGLFVNTMMGEMLDNFCGESFQDKESNNKLLLMNQLEFGNMMYAYIYLRYEELGPDLRMDVGCPACGKLNKDFVASLEDLEVRVKDEEHEHKHVYELKKPITLDGGKVITGVQLAVGKWDSMEKADQDVARNSAKMKSLLFQSSIVGAVDSKGPIEGYLDIKEIVKRLKKRDIEMCLRETVENNSGPLMAISGKCKFCKVEFFKELDWRYDYFFDSSSL